MANHTNPGYFFKIACESMEQYNQVFFNDFIITKTITRENLASQANY